MNAMKNKIIICLGLLLFALASCSNEKYSLLSDDGSTFLVNGIPATDGHEKIIKSLEDIGFVKTTEENNYISCKQSLDATSLTEDQINKLTGGIFDNLPSTSLSDLSKAGKIHIDLSWLSSDSMMYAFHIKIGEKITMTDQDKTEINKRLSKMYDCPKPISLFGDDIYQNKLKVTAHLSEDSFELHIGIMNEEIMSKMFDGALNQMKHNLENLGSELKSETEAIAVDSVIVGCDDDIEEVIVY